MIAVMTHPEQASPLRAIRSRHKLSQQSAADAVGVSRALWSAWELGTREMKVTQVAAVLDAFGLDDDELTGLLRWAAAVVC